jgi:hypothetical protein
VSKRDGAGHRRPIRSVTGRGRGRPRREHCNPAPSIDTPYVAWLRRVVATSFDLERGCLTEDVREPGGGWQSAAEDRMKAAADRSGYRRKSRRRRRRVVG